jgi:hypothetical protein
MTVGNELPIGCIWMPVFIAFCSAGCGSDSQVVGSGGMAAGGSGSMVMTTEAGGGNTAGMSGTGGANGAGAPDSGGGMSSNGSDGGQGFCSPGTTFDESLAYSMFGGPMTVCYGYKTSPTGITPDPFVAVTDIALQSPMTAGQPYAFSIDFAVATATNTLEFWGSGGLCGNADEKLFSESMRPGVLCTTFHPTAAHSHVLMVWHGSGSTEHKNVALCPIGSCPR